MTIATKTTIAVHIEAAPRVVDKFGLKLDRPKGGSFMIDARIDRPVWNRMKAAGAWHYSAEELEDMDMFDATPGWRYNVDALKVLLSADYTLTIRGETVTDSAQLDAMFSAQGQADYKARRAAEKAERERLAVEKRQNEERSRSRKESAYETWKETHLAGLVRTYANDGGDKSGAQWEPVKFFDADTPGTWYTTGDSWYSAEIDGHTCYKCHYGNACVSYAPQHIVDQWCEANWEWRVGVYKGDTAVAARHLLVDSLHDYIGHDIAVRLIEIHGTEHFVKLATSTEWWIFGESSLSWESGAAEHYGAPYVHLDAINAGTAVYTTAKFHLPTGELVQSYWRHPDGSIIARGYHESEIAIVEPAGLPEAIRQKL